MASDERYRILAVDDEQDALDVLAEVLESQYQVTTALSGEQALEILRQQPFDLLITDQRMPQMTGIQLIEAAKQISPDMVRIILTGYTEPRDLIDAINRGEVYRYITKPWDLNDLLFTIRNGLENLQLRRDKERLLADQQLRLNALTVFLDLSREAARVSSYQQLVQAVLKYLPYIVEFDACAALLADEGSGRALLDIHCRVPMPTAQMEQLRREAIAAFAEEIGHRIAEDELLLQVTGDQTPPAGPVPALRSGVRVLLRSAGEPVGLLHLASRSEGAFREDTRQLLDILANQTADIIHGLRDQLSSERHRLELMVHSLPDGVIMVDDRDRVFVINPAARRLLHLAADAPVDTRYLKEMLGFYPFDLVRGWAARDEIIIREEIQVFERTLHSIVSPVTRGDKMIGVAVVLRDISEQKLLDQRKEEFVSVVSHELRTPLTSIGGALDLMLHRYAGDINDKQQRYLELAKGSCDKLNVIIDDLLDLNRFADGRLEMELQPLVLDDLVREAAENYAAVAEDKGVALEVAVVEADGGLRIEGDRNRLHQVLNNLLANALKFTEQGGHIRIELFRSPAVLDLVGVSVFNDGAEIDERDHERIFDKFEQARHSRTGSVSGSGLGLSISKSIVESHGGRIWVESGRGQGTRFVFTLALSGEEPPPVQQEVALALGGEPARFKVPPKVLVVDDDPPTTFIVKGLLMERGYNVVVTHDGHEALRLARERQPDLILMDIRMPVVDGLQVTDILHHDPETQEIPVLVVSVAEAEQEAYQAGAAAYLAKPFRLGQLVVTVQELLARHNLITRMFKVLIVDDDDAIRAVCREVLEKQGYAVLEAESGQEGLDLMARSAVDVVLLDVMLPDFDGFQITERIRADRNLADLPIIFISARGQTSDKVRALKLGGDDYMVKPFDALELGARVDSLVQRKERELDSSPTTKLPGSVALQREIIRRISAAKPFSLCYLDLDNLKAFNDYYGYAKADGVIAQTGDLIRKAVEKHGQAGDFVGHIAGDDFVLLTETERIDAIGNEIITSFDRIIPLYYQDADRDRGYIEAEDRFGKLRRFGIMSISLAAVNAAPGDFRTHGELAARAAELKKRAKAVSGSVLLQAGGTDEPDAAG